jgi:hypothetical protein
MPRPYSCKAGACVRRREPGVTPALARPHDQVYSSQLCSLRLAAQDVALSRRKQGFESPRERQLINQ